MNQTTASRRIWIRKPNGVPTTLRVSQDDLVDDLKTLVMQKYPTTLAKDYDPADLIIRLEVTYNSSSSPSNGNQFAKKQQKLHPFNNSAHDVRHKQANLPVSPIPISSTRSPLLTQAPSFPRPSSINDDEARKSASPFSGINTVLRPDQNVWKVLDQYYPNGMTMNDALVIDIPQMTPTQLHHPPHRDSGYSSVFNSYVSPQKETSHGEAAKTLQQSSQTLLQHPHRSSQGSSFSGEARQSVAKRSNVLHRRSQSNPQSPSSASFANNANNTTILMLPKDYNGKERASNVNELNDSKQKSLNKLTVTKPEETPRTTVSPASATTQISSSKKIKSTTEKVFPSINVLIVEDNKINQKILQTFLRRRKINFQTAVNGEEAIQKWREGGFHLVLMDIQLPVKSGIEAAIEIRRLEKLNKIGIFTSNSSSNNTKLLPADELNLSMFRSPVIIVALTASTSSLDRQKALAAGCNDYLTKPVNLDWLQNKITEWGCMQALIDFDHWKD